MGSVTGLMLFDKYGTALDIAIAWLKRDLTIAEEFIVEKIVTPTTIAAAQARIELLRQNLI